jgi:hypothetical protein
LRKIASLRAVVLFVAGVGCAPPSIGEEPAAIHNPDDPSAAPQQQHSAAPASSATPSTTATTRSAPLPLPLDAGATVAAAPQCTEAGAVQAAGHCYFGLSTPQTWDGGLTACAALGAHLATLTTDAEQKAAATVFPTTERWIGLRRATGTPVVDASYAWITGEARGFQHWAQSEPNAGCPTCNANIVAECGRMIATDEWADDSCGAQHPVVCERD